MKKNLFTQIISTVLCLMMFCSAISVVSYAAPSATTCKTHTYDTGKVTKKATCVKTGVKTYTCKKCGTTKTEKLDKTAHSYKPVASKKATLDKNGSATTKVCTVCGKTKTLSKATSIAKVKSIKLSKTKLNYTAKTVRPTVTVKDANGKKLKNGVDYTVKYSSSKSKAIGNYTVKVTLKGNYKGSKTLKYKIVVPATSDVKVKNVTKEQTIQKTAKNYSATNKKTVPETRTVGKGIKVYWKQVKGVTGYQVMYSLRSDFSSKKKYNYTRLEQEWLGKETTPVTATYTKKVKGSDKTSTVINGVIAAKYYVKVRTYITKGDKTYYSAWSDVKTIKAKYNCVTISSGKLVYDGNKYHVCLNEKDHRQISKNEQIVCPSCYSRNCNGHYILDSETGTFGAGCPKYVPDVERCRVCNKPVGIGEGKCISFNMDGACPICGKYVPADVCHECLG